MVRFKKEQIRLRQLFRLIALTLTISSAISWLSEETFAHSTFCGTKDHSVTFVSEHSNNQTVLETESETDSHADISNVILSATTDTLSTTPESVSRFFEFKSVSKPSIAHALGRFFNLPPPRV